MIINISSKVVNRPCGHQVKQPPTIRGEILCMHIIIWETNKQHPSNLLNKPYENILIG